MEWVGLSGSHSNTGGMGGVWGGEGVPCGRQGTEMTSSILALQGQVHRCRNGGQQRAWDMCP